MSAHLDMCLLLNFCVRLQILILEILNVFLRLKFLPSLILNKIHYLRMDTEYLIT